jgi:hypothetical protein
MATSLNIQANVIDIKTDTPQPSDIFLVDTNVWLWQTYSRLSSQEFARFAASNRQRARSEAQRAREKIAEYTPYIEKVLLSGATIVYSGLILAELAHIIEKTEYEIYKNKGGVSLKLKEYRHNLTTERANVVAEVQSAWSQVEAIAVCADLIINDETTQAALTRFQTQALDGYDLLLLEAIGQAGSGQIRVITDDMDYATVSGIQVFTSNSFALSEAGVQGKLLGR